MRASLSIVVALGVILVSPARAQAQSTFTCESQVNESNRQILGRGGFTRMHGNVRVVPNTVTAPLFVVQAVSPDFARFVDFRMAGLFNATADLAYPTFFGFEIQEGKGRPAARVRQSKQATFFASDFEFTIVNDAGGKLEMTIVAPGPDGKPERQIVALNIDPLEAGPVALYCGGGSFSVTNFTME